jgi:hypothetical protein
MATTSQIRDHPSLFGNRTSKGARTPPESMISFAVSVVKSEC